MAARAGAGLLLVAAIAVAGASAQSGPSLESADMCVEISPTSIALGTAGEPSGSFPLSAVRDGTGRYWVVNAASQTVVRIYDGTGKSLREIDASGQPVGSGGINKIQRWRADSIGAWDVSNARVMVFDPEMTISRFEPVFAETGRGVALPGDTLVLVGSFPSVERAGLGLHSVVGQRVITSFDGSNAYRRDLDATYRRIVTHSRAGGVWAVEPAGGVARHWSSGGGLVQELKWDSSPMRPASSVDMIVTRAVIDVLEDDNGLLWVLSEVASGPASSDVSPAEIDPVRRSMIEVVDPIAGELRSALLSPVWLLGWLEEGSAYSFSGPPGGYGEVEVRPVTLQLCEEA